MKVLKEFFFNLPQTWWGITIIIFVSVLIWLMLSVLLYKSFFKRTYDILFSLCLMPFLVILTIPIALAIKKEDKGPVFYCSKRVGKNGKIFKMFKYRSMKVNSPDIRMEDGSTFNSKNDERVTKVGAFLRKTSLDEIPQILNILLGQMSFIGPRPDPVDWLEKYTEEQKMFLKVRPGITGYNQAYFRNSNDAQEKISNDVLYAKKYSIFMDIKILFKTVKVVIKHENLYRSEE